MGWYENRDLFHKIGYLVAAGPPRSTNSSSCRRTDQARVRGARSTRGSATTSTLRDADLASSRYGSDEDGGGAAADERRDGPAHDSTPPSAIPSRSTRRGRWSLEHIHAQNAEQLNRAAQWVEWLRLHRDALAGLPTISSCRVARSQGGPRRSHRADRHRHRRHLRGSVRASGARSSPTLFSLAGDERGCRRNREPRAAGGGDNSALSNSVFEVKRRSVLERDRPGRTSRSARATCSSSTTRRRRAADPLLGPARPRGLPRRDADNTSVPYLLDEDAT